MKISAVQRNATSLYWTKVLTGEIATESLPTTSFHRAGYLRKLATDNPSWPILFMSNLDRLLTNAETSIGLSFDSVVSDNLLRQAAEIVNIPEGLFPTDKLFMTFDTEDNLIVNGKKIKSQDILGTVDNCSTDAATLTSPAVSVASTETLHKKNPVETGIVHSSSVNDASVPENKTESEKQIQLFVKTLTDKTLTIECTTKEKIWDIKIRASQKTGIPPTKFAIILNGKQAEDTRSISDYGKIEHALSCKETGTVPFENMFSKVQPARVIEPSHTSYNFCFRMLSYISLVLGAAALIIAFAALNVATLGTTAGVALAVAGGAGMLLGGFGLYATRNTNSENCSLFPTGCCPQ